MRKYKWTKRMCYHDNQLGELSKAGLFSRFLFYFLLLSLQGLKICSREGQSACFRADGSSRDLPVYAFVLGGPPEKAIQTQLIAY